MANNTVPIATWTTPSGAHWGRVFDGTLNKLHRWRVRREDRHYNKALCGRSTSQLIVWPTNQDQTENKCKRCLAVEG